MEHNLANANIAFFSLHPLFVSLAAVSLFFPSFLADMATPLAWPSSRLIVAATYKNASKSRRSISITFRQQKSQGNRNRNRTWHYAREDSADTSRIAYVIPRVPYHLTRAPSLIFVDLATTASRR